jgi:glycosyltransferase involved in cell wall biosynthesis
MIIGIDATNIRAGGGVTHLKELLNHSNPEINNFKKIIVWSSNITLSKIQNKSWIIKKSPKFLNQNLFFRIFWQIFFLKREAKKNKCDIIFVPGGSVSTSFRPIVTMSRNMLPFESKELNRFGFTFTFFKLYLLKFIQIRSFRSANGLIFLNNYAKENIIKYLNKRKLNYSIIPHGVSSNFLFNPQIRNFKNFDNFTYNNPCKILYVSIIDNYKHQKNVILAINNLRKQNIPVSIDLIGPPGLGYKEFNKVLNNINNHKDFIYYHGNVDHNVLNKYYYNADIFLFASTCENMPNILLESMAAGLPIACSNAGPMPEILKDCGVYFDSENINSIETTLSNLIKSKQIRENLSSKVYLESLNYNWGKCTDETFQYLNNFKMKKVN